MNQNKAYKSLKYSIRQCGKDEIEIRNSFFDGYTRGFIRLLFIGIFCMSWYQNAKYKQPPFSYEIAAIKEDIIALLEDRSVPGDELVYNELAEEIMENPPIQGYLTISNALQWRLQYRRVISLDNKIDGVINFDW